MHNVDPGSAPGNDLPVEGRPDVAADLEEEERNAYSSQRATAHARDQEATSRTQPPTTKTPEQPQPYLATQPPAEGRSDIAENWDEEQRNAYSAHQKAGI